MAQFGFFQYIRLKFVVSLIRLISWWKTPKPTFQLPSSIERHLMLIPSRDAGRFIKAWLYRPKIVTPEEGKRPILVNWHGSGFVLDGLGTDHHFCRRVVDVTRAFVLDADYRKSPETPFPGALDDVVDMLRWVGEQHWIFDVGRIAVSGFSAGGNLALVAASVLKEEYPNINIEIAVAMYPPVDLATDPRDKTVPKPINPIPARVAELFDECYTPDKETRTDPRVSPAFADPDLFSDRVLILTASGDTLAPEARRLGKNLVQGSRRVVNLEVRGVGHGFDKGCEEKSYEWRQREDAYKAVCRELYSAFHGGV